MREAEPRAHQETAEDYVEATAYLSASIGSVSNFHGNGWSV